MYSILKNFHILDEELDVPGTVIIEDGFISRILPGQQNADYGGPAGIIIDGASLSPRRSGKLPVLMPAFVDLHAHFRDPGSLPPVPSYAESPLPSEVLESASLSAAAGGFGTVVCMANTKPVIDSLEKVLTLKKRSDVLGLIDLYPVMSLTKGMDGKELSEITGISPRTDKCQSGAPLMLSEDGKDIADDALFLAAMKEAERLDLPISCHCDFGGDEAAAAKKAGKPRSVWSRIEENNALRRVIELGKKAGCHIHIAHVSTKEAVEMILKAKAAIKAGGGFVLTCEAMPHNLCLSEEAAAKLGEESWGRVNPPLRSEEDRKALVKAVADGVIDAIATDHAPHARTAKESGAAGFSGFETAFAALNTDLIRGGVIDLKQLSSLISARPAKLLGLNGGSQKRGRIISGYRADLVVVDNETPWTVDPEAFKTRGKNSAFAGYKLYGKILMTLHSGRVVFTAASVH